MSCCRQQQYAAAEANNGKQRREHSSGGEEGLGAAHGRACTGEGGQDAALGAVEPDGEARGAWPSETGERQRASGNRHGASTGVCGRTSVCVVTRDGRRQEEKHEQG